MKDTWAPKLSHREHFQRFYRQNRGIQMTRPLQVSQNRSSTFNTNWNSIFLPLFGWHSWETFPICSAAADPCTMQELLCLPSRIISHVNPSHAATEGLRWSSTVHNPQIQKPHSNWDISYSLITLQPAAVQPADWIRIRFVQFNCWPLLTTDCFVTANKAWNLLAEHCLLLQQVLNQRWQRIPRARGC